MSHYARTIKSSTLTHKMDGTIATQRRKISPSITMSDATTIKRACFYKNQIAGSNEKDSPTSLKSNSLFIPGEDHSASFVQLRIRDGDMASEEEEDDEDSENFESRDLDE